MACETVVYPGWLASMVLLMIKHETEGNFEPKVNVAATTEEGLFIMVSVWLAERVQQTAATAGPIISCLICI